MDFTAKIPHSPKIASRSIFAMFLNLLPPVSNMGGTEVGIASTHSLWKEILPERIETHRTRGREPPAMQKHKAITVRPSASKRLLFSEISARLCLHIGKKA